MPATKTYAVLVRGINVGGKKLAMSDLQRLLEALGCQDVVTYIQSGNAVLESDLSAREISDGLERLVADGLGLTVKVLVRTPEELAAIAGANPFLGREPTLSKLHVVFLDSAPTPAAVSSLDPGRSPADAFAVSGREIFIHYGNGAGRSKLTLDYFERKLGVAGTARNWNTLLKLRELAEH